MELQGLKQACAEKRPPEKNYIHGVAYQADVLANVVFRPVLRHVMGLRAMGYSTETLSSGLGKSYSSEYVGPSEECRTCRLLCQWLITPADNALMWLLGKERRTKDHCAESIAAHRGMPPRIHPKGFSPGDRP